MHYSKAKNAVTPAQDEQEAILVRLPVERLCNRRGQNHSFPIKTPGNILPAHARNDSVTDYGEIPIRLSKVLAKELGLLPAMVYKTGT